MVDKYNMTAAGHNWSTWRKKLF